MAADAEEGAVVVAEKDPRFPLTVDYCSVCGLPHEYCEFTPSFARCRAAHPEFHAAEAAETSPSSSDAADAAAATAAPAATEDGAQKRGGKGVARPDHVAAAAAEGGKSGRKKKKDDACVTMTLTQRNKRKHVTTVAGLDRFGVAKLADAAKLFSKRFSCGAAVVKSAAGSEEIDVQGDVREDLVDFIEEKFSVPPSAVYFVDGKDRRKARP